MDTEPLSKEKKLVIYSIEGYGAPSIKIGNRDGTL